MGRGLDIVEGMVRAVATTIEVAREAAHSRHLAEIYGALNQGRHEAAHFLGKAVPETPQFDDPSAAFNMTPREGYELKHGIEPPAVERRGPELDRD